MRCRGPRVVLACNLTVMARATSGRHGPSWERETQARAEACLCELRRGVQAHAENRVQRGHLDMGVRTLALPFDFFWYIKFAMYINISISNIN
jgi:hypothetical protein